MTRSEEKWRYYGLEEIEVGVGTPWIPLRLNPMCLARLRLCQRPP